MTADPITRVAAALAADQSLAGAGVAERSEGTMTKRHFILEYTSARTGKRLRERYESKEHRDAALATKKWAKPSSRPTAIDPEPQS